MTENFKLECKNPAYKNRLGKIEYGDNQSISGSDYLSKIVIDDSCITNGTIVGSIYAKSVTFDTLKVYDLSNKEINALIGVKYADNSTEYVNMGKYTIQEEINLETAKNGQYKGLDNLRLLDNQYICGITDFTNITIRDFLVDLCNQLNLTLGTTSFTNDNLPVVGNPFTNNETCRTVLSAILKCSLNFAIIDVDNNSLMIKWLDNEVTETFTKDDYDNLTKNDTYGPINSLIIRDPIVSGENVVRQDDDSIATNGENQFIIEETYFLYTEELRNQAIDNIWSKVKGLTYVDCKLTSSLGKPYLKVGQKISIEDDNGNYFDTYILKHNFTYDGSFYSIIESPTLTKEQENRKNNTDLKTRFRNAERQVDKINGQIIDIVEAQDEQKKQIVSVTTNLEGVTTRVSSVESGLKTTDKNVSDLQSEVQGVSANFNDFKDNEYINSISNLQNQIDGAIQFWNGPDIPTVNNYPASDWKTENDKNNHRADIYTVIKDVDGEMKQGKSYRFDKVNDVWQWIELTDNELSAVQAIANEANNRSKTNADSITKLQEQDAEFKIGLDNITGRVSKTETTVEDITTTTQTSTGGNNLYLEDALESNALEYHVDGKSVQDGTPTPDAPVEIKSIPSIRNLFDKNNINTLNASISSSGVISSNAKCKTLYIPVEPNKTYTIQKTLSTQFRASVYDNLPELNSVGTNTIANFSGTTITIESGSDSKYLAVFYYLSTGDTLTEQEILDSIMIETGSIAHPYVPYGTWAKVKITGNNILNNQDYVVGSIGSNGNDETSTTTYRFNNYNDCKPNTKIYLLKELCIYYYDKDKNFIFLDVNGGLTKTTPNNTRYVRFRTFARYFDTFNKDDYMVSYEPITEYEPYQEKEVLIDLNKPNLFDNSLFVQGTPYDSTSTIRTSAFIKKVSVGKTFTIKSNNSNLVFAIGFSSSNVQGNTTGIDESGWVTDNQYTITSIKEGYLWINVRYIDNSTITPSDINESDFKLYEGYKPYYEICSIGDTKDTLDIVNGQVVIDKKIDEVVLDGSETGWNMYAEGSDYFYYIPNINSVGNYSDALCSHFINSKKYPTQAGQFAIRNNGASLYFRTNISSVGEWKTRLNENQVTVKYVLAEPKQIILPNVQIPLFEGVNHITLVDDLETTTSIKYYRNTPIAQDYVVQQQLDGTNSNLADATSKIDSANKNYTDLSTNLSNNYYNKGQIDNINSSTTARITKVEKSVESSITSTQAELMIKQAIDTGINRIETTTGYTFKEDGLHTKKSDDPRESLVDNTGIYVNNGSTNMLTANDQGVSATNLTANNFIILYPIRQQKTTSETDPTQEGLGFFYIGE